MNTIAGILVLAWIAIALANTVSAWRYTWGLPLTEILGTMPPAAVIVAVKNASDVSRAFFGRLRHQAYPDYRIIAAVESEEDPAFAMVMEESKRRGAPRAIGFEGNVTPKDLATFLQTEGRQAVAHANKAPMINPDDTGQQRQMSVAASILRAAARSCIKSQFRIGENRWDQNDLR
jgi:hypothetical protein